jgi:hypothetical protein
VCPAILRCLQKWSGLDRRLLQDNARRGDVSGLRAISTTRRRAFLGALIRSNWSAPRKLTPLVNSGRTWVSHTLTYSVQFNNGTFPEHLMEGRSKGTKNLTFLSAYYRVFVSNLTPFTCLRNYTVSCKPKVNRSVIFFSFLRWGKPESTW